MSRSFGSAGYNSGMLLCDGVILLCYTVVSDNYYDNTVLRSEVMNLGKKTLSNKLN